MAEQVRVLSKSLDDCMANNQGMATNINSNVVNA